MGCAIDFRCPYLHESECSITLWTCKAWTSCVVTSLIGMAYNLNSTHRYLYSRKELKQWHDLLLSSPGNGLI